MLGGAVESFHEIPEGNDGALVTLQHMVRLINQPDPIADDFTDKMSVSVGTLGELTPVGLAEAVFEWVRLRMIYMPDFNGTWTNLQRGRLFQMHVIEELRSPGYTLHEIATLGNAVGDCDDYSIVYGAIYKRLGFPVTLVAVSRHEDRMLDHVYLAIDTDEGRIAVDGIVHEPFGWEVPDDEITNKVEVPV